MPFAGFFEKALEKAGHHVIACADGERALRALKFADGAFDLTADGYYDAWP